MNESTSNIISLEAVLRALLTPMADLAERTGVSLLLVSHLRKSSGIAKHAVVGSVAWVGAVRASHIVLPNPDNSTQRLFLPNGCNLSPSDVQGIIYDIQDRGDGPIVEWAGQTDISADDVMEAARVSTQEKECRRGLGDWLKAELGHGPLASQEILKRGRAHGFSSDQLNRALKRIGGRSVRKGFGEKGGWTWMLNPVESL